jgi:hypothetical protein
VLEVAYFSEQYPNLVGFPDDWNIFRLGPNELPELDYARSADFFVLIGQFGNPTWAGQLAGLLGRVIPEGCVLIVAFPVVLDEAMIAFLDRLGVQHANAMPARVETVHPAFTDFFAIYGGKAAKRFDGNDAAETLGQIENGEAGFDPAAVAVPRGRGAIYTVPYLFAHPDEQFAQLLADSITAHRADPGALMPDFLGELRLPGEDDVLRQIADVEAELAELRGRAAYLQHFRLLLGRATGEGLEALVIEALNVVFKGTEYRAEDRPDVRAEDFWIVGPDGDLAIAEVKGVNANVRRENVNQVDNHREAGGLTQEVPGLLIVNTFRGSETLGEREQPVPEQAMSRATNSNVLILRTRDLYNLVLRKFDGADASKELLDALRAGGGWLEVTPDAAIVKPDR